MPDTVSLTHEWSATTNVYVLLPPLAGGAALGSIYLLANFDAAANLSIWFGLTAASRPGSAAMLAASRIIDRGIPLTDGKPTIRTSGAANVIAEHTLPIFQLLPSSNLNLMVGLNAPHVGTKQVLIIVTILYKMDLASMFGIGRIIQTPGATPGPILGSRPQPSTGGPPA